MSENPYRPPQARDEIHLPAEPLVFAGTPESRNHGPSGLGGWLILIAIGLVLTPLKLGVLLTGTFLPMFTDGSVRALTTPGSEHYHSLWLPMIAYEVIGNGVFIVGSIVALILFFSRSRRFPHYYIVFLLANLAFLAIDELLGAKIPAVAASDDMTSLGQLVRVFVSCCIWVPYFLVSKRVKNTFV